ncbi:hypothetical protein [Streptomyces alanosinicus]|uniref:Secreted protein n=1 Tax=Streptomyces alanosinicus TaxID=68171 RepID=A0A918YSM0_9ACTN|nr:hypothetical protein [Streptomyces alanosinicus]GHE14036.1 hypothetical protein GCM10010339_83260 [Streptomyces alanosinicus]
MRKLQKVVIVVAAVSALTAISAGAGAAYADDNGYQECSPQVGAEANTPLAVLGLSDTLGTTCGQFNNAFTK